MTDKNHKYKFSPLETMVAKAVCGEGKENLLTPRLLETYQLAELKKQIRYAMANSTFFAEHLQGIDLEQINSYADLAKIPLMSADDIIEKGQSMACMPLNKIARFTTIRSSGTSGPSTQLYFTENDLY